MKTKFLDELRIESKIRLEKAANIAKHLGFEKIDSIRIPDSYSLKRKKSVSWLAKKYL